MKMDKDLCSSAGDIHHEQIVKKRKFRLLVGLVTGGAVLALVIGLSVGLTILRCEETKAEPRVRVGLLFPTNEAGEGMKEAAMLAVDDIRDHREKTPSGADIQVYSGDYDGSPEGALQAFRRLYDQQSVRLFVGPYTSADVARVAKWSAMNAPDAIFISPRATSEKLAQAKNVIRLSMGNQGLASALCAKLKDNNVSVVIPVHVEDSYSIDLVQKIRDFADGGNGGFTVDSSISYALGSITNKKEAQGPIEQLQNALQSNPDAVVLLVSYSEAKYILEGANGDSTLLGRAWYTSDSLALREDILGSHEAKQFAQMVSLHSLSYVGEGIQNGRRMRKMKRLGDRLKRAPPVFSPLAYDAVTLLYETCHLLHTIDPLVVLSRLPREAEWHTGLSGRLALDSSRGRAFGDYLHSFVAPAIPDPSKVIVAMTGSWMLDGLSQVSHMYGEFEQHGGVTRTEDPTGILSMSSVMSTAMSSSIVFKKADLLLSKGNCTNSTFSIAAMDPATYMKVAYKFTEGTFPDALVVSTIYGFSVQMSCDKPEGPVVLDVVCPPSAGQNNHIACAQTITSAAPTSQHFPNTRTLQPLQCLCTTAICVLCGSMFGASYGASDTSCFEQCFDVGDYCVPSTIICTELFVQGHMDAQTYLADAAFGRQLAAESPHVMEGYHTLASPIVWLMQRSDTATDIVKTFALPWAQHMSYLQDMADEGDEFGAAVMKIGMTLCGAFGRVLKATRAITAMGDAILLPILIAVTTIAAYHSMRKNTPK